MLIPNTIVEADRSAIDFVYDNFARHLQSGQAPAESRKETGTCGISGISGVPLVMANGTWRWENLHALLGTTDLLGLKSDGTAKRLGDNGAPRMFLAKESGSVLWLHANEFTSKGGRWSAPPTDHGLFAVRRYDNLDRLLANVVLGIKERPFALCCGVDKDPYEATAGIFLNKDPDIVHIGGTESAFYRVPILQDFVEAASGLPARIAKNTRKFFEDAVALCSAINQADSPGNLGVAELMALTKHACINLNSDATKEFSRLREGDTKAAQLLASVSLSPYGPEFDLMLRLAMKHEPGQPFSLGEPNVFD